MPLKYGVLTAMRDYFVYCAALWDRLESVTSIVNQSVKLQSRGTCCDVRKQAHKIDLKEQ